ncbi:Eco57I restriction-modification methylase domain-containing protein [Brevibacillus parabrevis]|uniref:Eco57I restriction-modification methylase domain-containing protein n=1 Tax=Brevibacillus parabrevis TaxID=54914 RepID=UPI002E1FFAF4|nr:N-6 DNA methylase [Brevibacillus parabrevis]MED1722058.1 N-6 DNA methylase [Brevibacillus parabrevis]
MNKKCQVFTPHDVVLELLDKVGYTSDLYGKRVIENACGDGNILKVIVERYIVDCLKKGISAFEIKLGLETDIYGAEIDEAHYLKCLDNLNSIASKYGIHEIKWNLLNVDILKEKLNIQFDFVIGNPPYITYTELDNETRVYIKDNYEVCKLGKFDYCYAFIESSLNMLSDKGKMAYLIPSSIFKNVFAQKLRDFLLPSLQQIFDYQTKKLFSALTSSAIIICCKEQKSDNVEYCDVVKGESIFLDKTNLKGKWEFIKKKNDFLDGKVKFSDFFSASISIATLFNKAFVIKDFQEVGDGNYVLVNNFQIEKEIVKVAVSPRSLNYGKNELIIFPYYYQNGILQKYDTDEFEQNFPEATRYLRQYEKSLLKRDSDKSVKWFEYGRTQALSHLNQEKLLLSTVVTKQVRVYELSEECIPYSGIYITSRGKLPLKFAKKILESEEFLSYVKSIGINANGMSLRITAKDINNYVFSTREAL